MRSTRELLLKYAQQSVDLMVRQDRKILCVYLTGSLLTPEPLLGHTTDIDLFVVYNDDPPVPRQVSPLNEDVHLDITFLPQNFFRQPRQVRVDPWMAPFLCQNPLCLHDTQHWFEFTQATVCANHERPEYRLQRSQAFSEKARQDWMDLNLGKVSGLPAIVHRYVSAMENAANAIASLSGAPLAGRRFLMQYPLRCAAVKRPGLSGGLTDLFVSQTPSAEEWNELLALWGKSLKEAAALSPTPVSLAGCRMRYYEQGASVLKDDHPEAALWLVLKTWTRAACLLPEDCPSLIAWHSFCNSQELGVEHLDMRFNSLDAYLDMGEATQESWSKSFGID